MSLPALIHFTPWYSTAGQLLSAEKSGRFVRKRKH
jgi:hypothetical protein